jgi:hypothetical protein
MKSGRRQQALWLTIATACAVYLCALDSPAYGQPGTGHLPVALGDIRSPELRRALEGEIVSLGGLRLSTQERARFVVQGSFTRLERRNVGHGLEVDCEVSLLLADARGGAVRLMLSGRAGARGGSDANAVERAAVEGAVRGALRPLPRTLRTLR